MNYSRDELVSIYELGRLYFEMGFFAPAERIFNGLSVVDGGQTPARLALGLIKLERGMFQEATVYFRVVIQSGVFVLQAKLAMAAAFLALNEMSRAKTMLSEIAKDMQSEQYRNSEIKLLWEAFSIRTEGAVN